MSDEKEQQESESKRQNCMICGSYVARTFVDIKGQRLHLCQQDAYLMLRMIARNEEIAFNNVKYFVEEQIYGRTKE